MAARKKTTKKKKKKKTAARKKTTTSRAGAADQRIATLEERLAALESQGEMAREVRELRLSLLPTLETYRNNVRVRTQFGTQMKWVLAGTVATILVVVAVLASSGVLSADAAAILLGGTLIYVVFQLRNLLLD